MQETALPRKACIKRHYFAIWNPLASSTLRMGRLQMTKTGRGNFVCSMLLGYVHPAYKCFKIVERKKPKLEH
ncbi:hypothetical protein CY35_06G095500 [Sphagnum magellanicum]|nr:hypothetical protein CY35_06G095500 [Sphagnum magellanicum]